MKTLFLMLILTMLIGCSAFKSNDTGPAPGSGEGQGDTPPVITPPPDVPPYDTPLDYTLSWTRPYCNTDDSELPLNELGGFNIYFGYQTDVFEPTINIADNTVNSFDFLVEADGNYHFELDAYNTSDVHSEHSGVVTMNCVDEVCDITNPTPVPNTCPFAPFHPAKIFFLQRTSQLTTSDKRKKGKATCPGFPLKDHSQKDLSYYSKSHRVTKLNRSPLIQCNARRFHNEETNKKHMVGYRKVKLHLPIYRSGRAQAHKNAIVMPYDLVNMSDSDKLALAELLGADTEKIKIKRAFKELPLNFRRDHDSRGGRYNDVTLNSDFALLNGQTLAGLSMSTLRICKEDDADNCYRARDFIDPEQEKSGFLKRQLRRHRLPMLRFHLPKEADLDAMVEALNSGSASIELFQNIEISKRQKAYVDFKFTNSPSNKRLPFASVQVNENSDFDLINKILSFNHPKKENQALSYTANLIRRKKITQQQLLTMSPQIVDVALKAWQKDDGENTTLKEHALDVLNLAYEGQGHPLGRLGEVYRIATKHHYSARSSLIAARRVLDLDDAIIARIDQRMAGPLQEFMHSKSEQFLTLEELYRKAGPNPEQRIDSVIKLAGSLSENFERYYEENYFASKDYVLKVLDVILLHKVTDERQELLVKFINNFLTHIGDTVTDYEGEYSQNLKMQALAFTKAIEYVLVENHDQVVVNLYGQILEFLYSKNWVYMHDFNDALEKTDQYLKDYKENNSQFYRIRGQYGFWTSRRETFLSDRLYALKLAEGPFIGSDESKKKYENLRSYYNALREREDIEYTEKRKALKEAYRRSIMSNPTEEQVQMDVQVLSWLSRSLYGLFDTKRKIMKLNKYVGSRNFDEKKFRKLQEAYNKFVRDGKDRLQALKRAELKVL